MVQLSTSFAYYVTFGISEVFPVDLPKMQQLVLAIVPLGMLFQVTLLLLLPDPRLTCKCDLWLPVTQMVFGDGTTAAKNEHWYMRIEVEVLEFRNEEGLLANGQHCDRQNDPCDPRLFIHLDM